ncbi:MAG: triose-phosphate isomerase [Candidatus Paceibacterota bacterium]
MVKAQKRKTVVKKRNTRRIAITKKTHKVTPIKKVRAQIKRRVASEVESKKFYVIANWKMNPTTLLKAEALFGAIRDGSRLLKHAKTIVCPPFLYLNTLKDGYSGKKVAFGAQTCFVEEYGPFTGEVSAPMIKSVGGEYVILGHSERRAMGETDEDVRARANSALSANLTPIICIGEHARDDDGEYLAVIKNQVHAIFYGMSRDWLRRVIIAYEPIWAIGKTGKDAVTAHGLHETGMYIRKVLAEMFDKSIAIEQRILYGGSVKAENAAALIDGTQVEGFLVGSASLNAEEFLKIIEAVESYAKK